MSNNARWNASEESCRIGNGTIHRIVDLESVPFAASMIYPDAMPEDIQKLSAEFGVQHFDPVSRDLLLSFQIGRAHV